MSNDSRNCLGGKTEAFMKFAIEKNGKNNVRQSGIIVDVHHHSLDRTLDK